LWEMEMHSDLDSLVDMVFSLLHLPSYIP
jgi:hypothetical protein